MTRLIWLLAVVLVCAGCGDAPTVGESVEMYAAPDALEMYEVQAWTIELTGVAGESPTISLTGDTVEVDGEVIECECKACAALKLWCAKYESQYIETER